MELKNPRAWFGLVAALYLLIFPWHPGLRSPNELCRLWQTRAIVELGKLSLNETIQKYGRVGDLSVVDGVLYPSKAPLMSFLAVPLYWVMFKAAGPAWVPELPQVFFSRLLLTVAPTLLMLVFVRRFLKAYLEGVLPEALTVAYALGTLAFSYSEAFFSHQATAVLLFFAFYLAWRTLRGELPKWGWAGAGALAGASVMAEYTAALTVVALAAWVAAAVLSRSEARERRFVDLAVAAGLVLLGAAPFLGGLMAYHQACFGHPLESGYKHLNDAGYQHWHVGGFLGIRLPDPSAFVLSFFSPLRGLFALSPFLMLALPGLHPLYRRERALFVFTVVLLVLNAYFTSSFDYTSWGWTTGPRHMTPLVPFLLLPAGLWLQALAAPGARLGTVLHPVAVGLVLSSVLVMGCVVFVNYVPDDVSTSLFGLCAPLFEAGYLAPTLLNFVGVTNPLAGLVPFALLFGALYLLGRALLASPRALLIAGAMVAVHLSLLRVATRHDDHDQGAVSFLKSVWLSPPGQTPRFW
ncbi:MAG: hypothetical protein IPJ65_27690 [Archangiaceae bacterium]|nr:hypothetical protein [Archangiaceae bacterium]